MKPRIKLPTKRTIPTVEDVARTLGMTKKEQDAVLALVDRLFVKKKKVAAKDRLHAASR